MEVELSLLDHLGHHRTVHKVENEPVPDDESADGFIVTPAWEEPAPARPTRPQRPADPTVPGSRPSPKAFTPDEEQPLAFRRPSLRSMVSEPGPPVRSPAVLELLRSQGLDDRVISMVANEFSHYVDLRLSTPPERMRIGGYQLASMVFPEDPPVLNLPAQVQVATRYVPEFPYGLNDLNPPPPLLYFQGTLPQRLLFVTGADYCSAMGMEIAAMVPEAARKAQASICALPSTQVGAAALQAASDAGLPAVAVLAHGLDFPTQHRWLLESVLSSGGALVTTSPLGTSTTVQSLSAANRTAAALAQVTLVAEVGVTDSTGSEPVAAAVGISRILVVPVSAHLLRGDGYVPATASGNYLLARVGAEVESVFGPGLRIRDRALELLPAADFTVDNPENLPATLESAFLEAIAAKR